ncbi:MAG: acyltransferase [Acidobacteria bacterium]|nr:MAG: acyltransferase [Acidobacteriota bacterium]
MSKNITNEQAIHSVPPNIPQRGNWFSKSLGKLILLVLGWRLVGRIPNIKKCVLVLAPHTSNWDFVIALATYFKLGLHTHWFGKHTLFKGLFGRFLRYIGGIPVARHTQHGFVQQLVDQFNKRDKMMLAVTPEGTRKKTKEWKKGFYYIASGANVPIFLVSFDYHKKELRFGPTVMPNGNYEEQSAEIRQFYADKTPKKKDFY